MSRCLFDVTQADIAVKTVFGLEAFSIFRDGLLLLGGAVTVGDHCGVAWIGEGAF
jgi:hypothetical protein